MALSTASTPSRDFGTRGPLIVGVTGGIGAGKSTLCKVLISMGFPVYNSDAEAKRLYGQDAQLRTSVAEEFGQEMFSENGELNREALANVVFQSEQALAKLNALVHPAVGREFAKWAKRLASRGCTCVFREAAILFESGAHFQCDKTWTVAAPLPVRLARAMKRSGLSEAEVMRRMSRQWTDEKRATYADEVVVNDGIQPLIPQVTQLVTQLALK